MEQAENDQKQEKMGRFRKFFRNKTKKGNATRHSLVMQEFKLLKKFSDDECLKNAPTLIAEFRKLHAAALEDEDDEDVFNDFINLKEEDNWMILFDHLNQFKDDKKM